MPTAVPTTASSAVPTTTFAEFAQRADYSLLDSLQAIQPLGHG